MYDGIVVRIKAIKYKEDSFYYLSSYPADFGLQAACLLTLILPALCLQNFCILSGTHLFTQAFSDPRSVLQSESAFAEFLADLQKS